MSDDWIKVRKKLLDDPRTVGIADRLGTSETHILGCLIAMWFLADSQADPETGFLANYSLERIDQRVRLPGFSAAVLEITRKHSDGPWIGVRNNGVVFPKYAEHNGPTAKRRALESRRKSDSRENVRKVSASDADEMRTRPDQNQTRADKKNQPPTTNDVAPVRAYAREVVGIDLERQLPVVEILADFGLAGVVEMLEHLASRKPSERFKGVRSIPALIKSLLAKTEEGALPREHEFTSFESWKADADARVAAIAGGGVRP